ncbi:MAG: hypothetical protein HYZ65_15570 [Burkholderiales bacterium]|nr:hypothetical protein [Burkholderiales bacterium]
MSSSRDQSLPTSPAGTATRIFATKFTPPVGSSNQVIRAQIDEKIRDAKSATLILIRAPAGFGKTTTMLQYHARLQSGGVAKCWLNLSSADNDVGHFFVCLEAALNGVTGETRVPVHRSGSVNVPVEGDGLDVLYRISALSIPFVLFMDDFEVIQNPVVLDVIRKMIDCLSPHGRLVIGSRHVPDIGLGRLRAHGRLLEIGFQNLRFSMDETADLMTSKHSLGLSGSDIVNLQRSTEGWAAALHLATLALASRENRSGLVAGLSGSNSDIADYLVEDVLARQPDDVRRFLLKTSVLSELCASLCSAVTGLADCSGMLEYLERANLFLEPIDSEGNWYRYHSLFAGFLRTQLTREFPLDVAELHLAASNWYLMQDRPVPAIEHALASGNVARSLPLLAEYADRLLLEGRFRLLARWLDVIPSQTLESYPNLGHVYVWALCSIHRYKEAMVLLENTALADTPGVDVQTWASTVALRGFSLAMMDRIEEYYETCTRDLPKMPLEPSFASGVMANATAYCYVMANKYDDARRIFDMANRLHAQAGNTFNMAITECVQGVMEMAQGRLRDATVRLRGAFSSVSRNRLRVVGGGPIVAVFLAAALYEGDELAEAEQLLGECMPLIKEIGTPDALILSHVTLARIACADGNQNRALQLLVELEHLGHRAALPRLVANAWLERARLAVLASDLDAAQTYLRQADNEDVWNISERFSTSANDVDTLHVGRLRVMVASGREAEALPLLKDQLRRAVNDQRYRRALKLRILLAQALHGAGQQRAGMRTLADALKFAHKEGFVRTMLDEGASIARLLHEYRGVMDDGTAAPLEVPAAFLDRLLLASGEAVVQMNLSSSAADSVAMEELSDREIQVLKMLAQGYSNRSIAERLFISENTIKTHLRKINAKLDVHNRMQAITVARRPMLIQ